MASKYWAQIMAKEYNSISNINKYLRWKKLDLEEFSLSACVQFAATSRSEFPRGCTRIAGRPRAESLSGQRGGPARGRSERAPLQAVLTGSTWHRGSAELLHYNHWLQIKLGLLW